MIKELKSKYDLAKGQRYSNLSRYFQSPDHALMPMKPKGYFTHGTAFELMLQDYAEGTNLFNDSFVVANLKGDIPDDLCLCIEKGSGVEELQNLIKYNKDKTPNKTQARAKTWIDTALDNVGKIPISRDTVDTLKVMLGNIIKVTIFGMRAGDVLRNSSWQQMITWKSYSGDVEIEKKAMIDVASIIEINGEETVVFFDIKTCATLYNFEKFFKTKYWIQDRHYTEGGYTKVDNLHPTMMFLAVEKQPPFLARSFDLPAHYIDKTTDAYKKLSYEYYHWQRKKQPRVGVLPHKQLTPYLDN